MFQGLSPESQGQNLVLSVLYVSNSLENDDVLQEKESADSTKRLRFQYPAFTVWVWFTSSGW